METTKEQLLSMKKGVWLAINPLRDINQIKSLTSVLEKEGEEFAFNIENTQMFRRMLSLFDNVGEPGYEIRKRSIGRGNFAEDLYFEERLIAIR